MVIMVKITIITYISYHLERCCILSQQWLLFTTRQQTVKGIILVMQMILNGIFISTLFICSHYYFVTLSPSRVLSFLLIQIIMVKDTYNSPNFQNLVSRIFILPNHEFMCVTKHSRVNIMIHLKLRNQPSVVSIEQN